MYSMKRRGFTLIELLVTLVLTGLMAGLAYKAMTASQRMTRTLSARVDAQSTARSALLYLATALRELNASDGDVISASSTAIAYRAMRWTGLSCSGLTTSGGNLQVTVPKVQLWGYRLPSPALDSMLVYAENNTNTRADDVWLVGALSDTTSVNCGAVAGMRLTFAINAASGGNAAATAGFTVGSPIRAFQHEEVSLYTNAGTSWFGHRTMNVAGVWTAVEPLVGPLTATGLSFAYYDTLNTVTATRTNIASVGVTVRSQSTEAGLTSTGIGNLRDSLFTRIALRNNRRF